MCSTIASSELTQEKTYLIKNAARCPLPAARKSGSGFRSESKSIKKKDRFLAV